MLIEHFILLFFLQIQNCLDYSISFLQMNKAFLLTKEIFLIRFLLYLLFWVLCLKHFYTYLNILSVVFRLAIANTLFYILFSLFIGVVFSTIELFSRSFFLMLVIACFLSPFILMSIKYFKNLIKNI